MSWWKIPGALPDPYTTQVVKDMEQEMRRAAFDLRGALYHVRTSRDRLVDTLEQLELDNWSGK